MLPYSLSPCPSLLGPHTKEPAQRKWRGERRTNTGRTLSLDMGRSKHLIKEVAKEACARPHSCVGCIIINDNNIVDDSNEEACIESSGFCMPRPDIKYKGSFITVKGDGLIFTGSLSNIGNEDNTSNDDALGITAVDDNNEKWNMVESEDTHARPYSCISIWKGEVHLIYKIFVEAQGADLRRFDYHKKRATLWTGEYPPVMNYTLFCDTQGIDVWRVSIP